MSERTGSGCGAPRRGAFLALALACGVLAAPGAAAAPVFQQWTTGNGARVLFYPAPELPMLDVRLTFAAGSTRDGEQAGVARLTNGLLAEAAAGAGAQEIAQAFAEVGAQFGNGSLREMAWLSLRTLSDEQYLRPALATFVDVLTRPEFRADDLERLRKQMLAALDDVDQSPDKLAERALYEALYAGHPYSNPPEGRRETVRALTLDNVRAFYRRYYVARNLTIGLVGDLDREGARSLAEGLAAGLAPGEAPPSLPVPTQLQAAQKIYVPFPSRQAHILIGTLGMRRDDPAYFPLYLANHVFGGSGFASRLLSSVRERHGLAYSAYSYFVPMAERGPFILGVQTRAEQVERAIELIREELTRYLREGATAEELQAARDNVTGGFALRIDSNRKLLQYLTTIGYYGLDLDYLDGFNERVKAVNLEQMRDALSARIDPERLVTVVVGPLADEDEPAQ